MTMPKLSKNKLLIIALVVVAVVGYYLFMSGSEPEPLTVVEAGGDAATISQQLIIELNRLKALRNIDDSIFRDPTFTSLQDFTQSVVAQPLGRSNPFAPIGSN